ncbi:MAG: hypothetical protein M1298_00270, partial [Chloroflexi bacterium]|nr:hypothetical protein [Chloroflexota bacterium]
MRTVFLIVLLIAIGVIVLVFHSTAQAPTFLKAIPTVVSVTTTTTTNVTSAVDTKLDQFLATV